MNVWKTVGIYWMIAVETDVFWSSRGKNINIFLLSSLSIGRCVAQTTSDQQPSFHPTSCLVYLLRGASKCGIYKLYDSKSGNCFPAYCDLKSERGTAWTLVFHGVLVIAGFLLFPISFQVKFPSERKRAKLKSLPHKSGANEITAGSLHPLASNMQLRDSRHRFQRLPQQKLQGLQHHGLYWGRPRKDFNIAVEYINIREHVGTHVAEAKFIHSAYWQHIHSLSV